VSHDSPQRLRRTAATALVVLGVLAAGPILAVATGEARLDGDWRTGSRESAGIAPAPGAHPEAVVQVYGARALGWRGAFGVHTWIAVKEAGAPAYQVYEVIGWRHYHGLPSVRISRRPPDGRWFGAQPVLLADLRGAPAQRAAAGIDAVARDYRYTNDYRVWPGPNSNTFTAHIARAVPELAVHLPSTAIGKDYTGDDLLTTSPSGTGYQISLFGLLGVMIARVEGFEINLLGLTFGVDPRPLALKLPGIGRVSPWSSGEPETIGTVTRGM
jgi:hypothetical protein